MLQDNNMQSSNVTSDTDPINITIGNNIRYLRNFYKYNQKTVAVQIEITFQQLQKYEKGISEISAAKLYRLAKFFNVEVGFLFEEFRDPISLINRYQSNPNNAVNENAKIIDYSTKQNIDSETLNIIRTLLNNKTS